MSKRNKGNNIGKVMNGAAQFMAFQTANTACFWVFHQPEFPESAQKYIKNK